MLLFVFLSAKLVPVVANTNLQNQPIIVTFPVICRWY